jgi:hypothetical protein
VAFDGDELAGAEVDGVDELELDDDEDSDLAAVDSDEPPAVVPLDDDSFDGDGSFEEPSDPFAPERESVR